MPQPAKPLAVFRGVIAMELNEGTPPERAAMSAYAAGELAAWIGRDLVKLAPAVRRCDLALMAAHFDPTEMLRPGWPLHTHLVDLVRSAPSAARGFAQEPRMLGFGTDDNGELPESMRADPALTGGLLRVMPFVLRGEGVEEASDVLEEQVFDHGLAEADAALAVQQGLGVQLAHMRYMSLDDLLAMIAMQFQNVGLDGLWSLLETALLNPQGESVLDTPLEPLARYGDNEVRIAMLDPPAWQQRHAPQETDADALAHDFALFQMRQRQYAAVLEAHGVPVQFVHCADGDVNCLR